MSGRLRRVRAPLAGILVLLAAALLAPLALASPPKHMRAESKASKAPGSGQSTRLVRTGPDLDVQTGNLRLTDAARGRLERIAARFHKVTKRRLVITGGSRTPTSSPKALASASFEAAKPFSAQVWSTSRMRSGAG